MSSSPLVTVVIPTYYRNDMLEECLSAVKNQTHEPIEITVVDDSGERFAKDTLDQFNDVNYLPLETNQGPNFARNKGIENSSGA